MSDLPTKKRPDLARLNFDVSPKLMEQIKARAISEGVTLRGYMLKLLEAEGFDVRDRAPFVDGRTLRGNRDQAIKSSENNVE
jgi:hypothetical protein